MIGDILGEVTGFVVRTLIIDVIGEIVVKGPGYVILSIFRTKGSREVSDGWAAVVGIVFWILIGGAGYAIYRYMENGS